MFQGLIFYSKSVIGASGSFSTSKISKAAVTLALLLLTVALTSISLFSGIGGGKANS